MIYVFVVVDVLCACACACACVCVLAVYNKAQAQRISNREFKLWTFLQGTESRVATFLAETCLMSHQNVSVYLWICIIVWGGELACTGCIKDILTA